MAEGYIEETVNALQKATHQGCGDSHGGNKLAAESTLQWAAEALAEYFDTVDRTPTIQAAREVFEQILSESGVSPGHKRPYVCAERPRASVSYHDMLSLAAQRRSIRWYEQQSVPHELLDQAIEVARQSPSACSRQPFRFLIYDEPDLVQKIAQLPGGATDFAENIPCLVVLVGQQRAYFSDRDLHLIYIDRSLAAMTSMYALETLGLASCCINWPNTIQADRVASNLLSFEPDERIILLMAA